MPARRLYDRFWPHPEVTAVVRPHLTPAAMVELERLVEAGDPAPIRDWLARTELPADARAAVRPAVPPVGAWPALFDEIAVGRVCEHDGCGTIDWVLSRRAGATFRHRVYDDAAGRTVRRWDTPRPLTRKQFEHLTRSRPWLDWDPELTAGACGVTVESIWDGPLDV